MLIKYTCLTLRTAKPPTLSLTPDRDRKDLLVLIMLNINFAAIRNFLGEIFDFFSFFGNFHEVSSHSFIMNTQFRRSFLARHSKLNNVCIQDDGDGFPTSTLVALLAKEQLP